MPTASGWPYRLYVALCRAIDWGQRLEGVAVESTLARLSLRLRGIRRAAMFPWNELKANRTKSIHPRKRHYFCNRGDWDISWRHTENDPFFAKRGKCRPMVITSRQVMVKLRTSAFSRNLEILMENVGVAGTLPRGRMMADEAKHSAIDRLCGLWFADGVLSPVYLVQQEGAGWNWTRAESPIMGGFRGAEPMADVRQGNKAPRVADQGRADACGAQGEGMIEASTVGMWVADAAGRTIFVCSKWSEIAGLPPEKAVGHGWLRAIHPEDVESVARQWRRAVSEKLAFIISVRFVHAGGSVVRTLCQAAPVVDQEGQQVRWVGTLLEVPDEIRPNHGRSKEPMARGGDGDSGRRRGRKARKEEANEIPRQG